MDILTDEQAIQKVEEAFGAKWIPCIMFRGECVLVIGAGSDGRGGEEIARANTGGWSTWKPGTPYVFDPPIYGHSATGGKAEASRNLLEGVAKGDIVLGVS